jgi:hypothetical protein
MNDLRAMIRPMVEKDTQKLVTQEQFDNAMTTDATTGTGNGGPIGPGGGGGGIGGAPALQPFIEGRVVSVKAQLDGQTPLNITVAPATLFFAQTVGSSAAGSQSLTLAFSETGKSAPFTARLRLHGSRLKRSQVRRLRSCGFRPVRQDSERGPIPAP